MIVTEISSVIELSQGLNSRKMTAIVYFLSLSIRIQGSQDSPRPRSTKLDDSCPHDPQEWGKQGRTDHWPTDSFGVCLWGRGKQAAIRWQHGFLAAWQGACHQKQRLARLLQVPSAGGCASNVVNWAPGLYMSQNWWHKAWHREKLLKVGFQLDRTGMRGQGKEKVQVNVEKECHWWCPVDYFLRMNKKL